MHSDTSRHTRYIYVLSVNETVENKRKRKFCDELTIRGTYLLPHPLPRRHSHLGSYGQAVLYLYLITYSLGNYF